jgi:small subunit ribosomal protein S6
MARTACLSNQRRASICNNEYCIETKVDAPPAPAFALSALRLPPDALPKEGGHFVKRDYELGFILNPEVNEEQTGALLQRIEQIATNHDGQVVQVNQWGRRRLAYPIEHNRDGLYVFVDMILTPESIAELDRSLKVTEEVLRHIIVKRDPKAVEREREARAARAQAQTQTQTVAQESTPAVEEAVPETGEEEVTPAISDEEIEYIPPAIEDESSEA